MINIYEVPKDKVQALKKILEAPDEQGEELDVELEKEAGKGKKEKAKSWKINEFKKQGYTLREAKAIGLEGDSSFLYLKGTDDFFERNEQVILEAGAKKIEGDNHEKVKEAVEKQDADTSSGVGFVFG